MRRLALLFLPVGIGWLSALTLYANNRDHYALHALTAPLLAATGVGLAFLLIFAFLGKSWETGGVLGGICSLAFFSFGHIYNVLASALVTHPVLVHLLRSGLAVAVALLTTIVGLAVLRHMRSARRWAAGLGLAILALVVLRAVEFASVAAAASAARASSPAAPSRGREVLPSSSRLPNIYWIILDGYARSDVLERLYGMDNRFFLHELEKRGFCVAPQAETGYLYSVLSDISVLNAAWIAELIPPSVQGEARLRAYEFYFNNSRVTSFLRERGYQILATRTGYDPLEMTSADLRPLESRAIGSFFEAFLETTAIQSLNQPHRKYRERIWRNLHFLETAASGRQPAFLFAHLTVPHPPFVVNANGEPINEHLPVTLNDGADYVDVLATLDEYNRDYRGQVLWISRRILTTLDAILAREDVPPVILLTSDHGCRRDLRAEDLEGSPVWAAAGILWAARVPGLDPADVPPRFYAINSFPLIFNTVFKAGWPMKENVTWWTDFLGTLPARKVEAAKLRLPPPSPESAADQSR